MPACFSPHVAEPKSAATDPLYDRADDHAVLRPFRAFGIGWVRTLAVVPRPTYPGRRTQGGASLYPGLAHVAPLGRKGQRPEARIVICEDS
jgi:hypothetical protein